MQGLLTSLLLPPLLLVLVALAGGLLAWRGRRRAGAVAALAAALLMLLATPFASANLALLLERRILPPPAGTPPPGAIIVLGGEMVRGEDGPEVGPLTLERLRAAAALHRRTGLPLLVTGGALSRGAPPIGVLMAQVLRRDFGVAVRWIEPRAGDTRQNALLGAAMLREEGIGAAFVVSQAWHLPRAQGAFARASFPVTAAPVRRGVPPVAASLSSWLPRPDHLTLSWYALREGAGLVVYRLRDGDRSAGVTTGG